MPPRQSQSPVLALALALMRVAIASQAPLLGPPPALAQPPGVSQPSVVPPSRGLPPAAPPERAAGSRATVLSVGDGDTLRVRQDGRPLTIRLACIDAPEMAQGPWGQRSRDDLRQRLPSGQEVSVVPHTIDRFGRLVAEVTTDRSINLALVEDGQAFVYRRYLGGCDAKAYLEAEARAARQRLGVWQVPGGIPRPWDFRQRRKAVLIPDGTTPGGRRYRCDEIGSHARAQELLRQGHRYLDRDGDGEACEGLR